MGGAVTIDMARRGEFKNQIKGLILENTFTSIQDVVFSFIPNWLFPVKCYLLFVLTGVWMSLEKMKSISEDIPVLLIKSWQDQLVKKEQMDRLEAAFRLSKRRV